MLGSINDEINALFCLTPTDDENCIKNGQSKIQILHDVNDGLTFLLRYRYFLYLNYKWSYGTFFQKLLFIFHHYSAELLYVSG